METKLTYNEQYLLSILVNDGKADKDKALKFVTNRFDVPDQVLDFIAWGYSGDEYIDLMNENKIIRFELDDKYTLESPEVPALIGFKLLVRFKVNFDIPYLGIVLDCVDRVELGRYILDHFNIVKERGKRYRTSTIYYVVLS